MCDRGGQKPAYVYFEDEPGRQAAGKLLTKDEARRIAANMARLPKLSGAPAMNEPPDEDENERTNSIGLFNYTEAYRLSAAGLRLQKVGVGHADEVVRSLYYHALELYLKALLRQKHSVEAITKKFRHDVKRIVKEAEKLGLQLMDEDRTVFGIMAETNAILEAR